jgi:hypothetical protein
MIQQRNIFIDSLKGIAIILMVAGHSGCPELLHDYIPENMWWLLLTICSILISLVLMRTEELTCFAISKIKNK